MRAYKLLLWKAYFDKGWALTNYFKYIFAFVGIFNLVSARNAIYLGVIYGVSCLLIGWIWYKCGFIETENEINNIFNPFQKEIRAKLKRRNI